MKSVAVHAVLALVGLVLAYQTWTRGEAPAEQDEGQVVVLACEADALEGVSLETPTHQVAVAPQRGKKGEATQYWITTQRKKKDDAEKDGPEKDGEKDGADKRDEAASPLAQADAGQAESGSAGAGADGDATTPPAEPEKPQNPRPHDPDAPFVFLADAEKVTALIDDLTPLRAVRGLGAPPEDKLETFGFDDIGTYLRVECGGTKLELGVGERTYGTGNRYALDAKTNQAYLLEGRLVTDLQSARVKFMRTSLHAFDSKQVEEVTLHARGLDKRLLHRDRQTDRAQWVDAAEPDRRNELYGNWFERFERLRIKAYLPEGAEPGSDLVVEGSAPQPVVRAEYRGDGKKLGELELVRIDVGDESFFYARTETTRRWTTMYDSLAKLVAQDVGLVIGAEEAPTEASEPGQSGSPGAPGATDSSAAPGADPASVTPQATPAAPAVPAGPGHGMPHGLPHGHPPTH